jgi:hypothetical protein
MLFNWMLWVENLRTVFEKGEWVPMAAFCEIITRS